VAFLAVLLAVFVVQLIAGQGLDDHPRDNTDLETICVLVIICFLIGISLAWELVGGPNIGLGHEIVRLLKSRPEAGTGDERA
jgi:hypothetical protein